jgi:hypothetical protein
MYQRTLLSPQGMNIVWGIIHYARGLSVLCHKSLRKYIKSKLPEYMIPQFFIQVE